MRRWLFNFAAAISLVLCLGTAALWVRSESASTRIISRRGWMYADMAGGFLVQTLSDPTNKYLPLIDGSDQNTPLGVAGKQLYRKLGWLLPGVSLYWGESAPPSPPVRVIVVQMDYWPLVLLWAILPLWAGVRRIRPIIRQQIGRCIVCGYDLTGNASGTCPECGTPIAGKAEAKA